MSESEFDESVIKAVTTAHVAVNVVSYFSIFIALFAGVMLGIFNAAEDVSEPQDFALGFTAIFFLIAIPAWISGKVIKACIAQPEVWKQALVWFYCLLLLPIFPMGTGAAAVVLYGQVKWMKGQPS